MITFTGCTTAQNGAINRTVKKQTAKGYNIFDKVRQIEHVYSQPVIMRHQEKLTLYCREHKGWEVIKAFWEPTDDEYYYVINRHKKW